MRTLLSRIELTVISAKNRLLMHEASERRESRDALPESIPKPKGTAGNDYNLLTEMGLDGTNPKECTLYRDILVSPRSGLILMDLHLTE